LERHQVEVSLEPEAALAAIAERAEGWGGHWTRGAPGDPTRLAGRLALPVVFGLRRGVAVGTIEVEPLDSASGARSRAVWTLAESHLEVHRGSVAVLSLAAVPLVGTLAWPLWRPLAALAPVAIVLGFLAWWLVVSRLRSSGPEEFLADLDAAGGRRE
jgi:hypothetical protein